LPTFAVIVPLGSARTAVVPSSFSDPAGDCQKISHTMKPLERDSGDLLSHRPVIGTAFVEMAGRAVPWYL
jgi:hypothetical protein